MIVKVALAVPPLGRIDPAATLSSPIVRGSSIEEMTVATDAAEGKLGPVSDNVTVTSPVFPIRFSRTPPMRMLYATSVGDVTSVLPARVTVFPLAVAVTVKVTSGRVSS